MTRTALVTGAGRGIGAAIAKVFAEDGHNVILHCNQNLEKAQALASALEADYGIKTVVLQADLSDMDAVAQLAEHATAAFGRVDVLINNAGVAPFGDFGEKVIDDWHQAMAVNLYAPFVLTQRLAPKMMDGGAIVNIATIDVMTTFNPESAEYDASKAALINLTRNSALAYAPRVRVNAVAPGWVLTDMNAQMPDELLQAQAAKVALGRMADPAEIASVVHFLAGPGASYVNGAVLEVDGGYRRTS